MSAASSTGVNGPGVVGGSGFVPTAVIVTTNSTSSAVSNSALINSALTAQDALGGGDVIVDSAGKGTVYIANTLVWSKSRLVIAGGITLKMYPTVANGDPVPMFRNYAYVNRATLGNPITSMTYAAGSPGTVTVVTTNPHGLSVLNEVAIWGAMQSGYNGIFPVYKVDSATQFEYIPDEPPTVLTATASTCLLDNTNSRNDGGAHIPTAFTLASIGAATTAITLAAVPVPAQNINFTATPSGTSATLSATWTGVTGQYGLMFNDGEYRLVTLTNSATTCTWTGALTGAPSQFGNKLVMTSAQLNANWASVTGTYMVVFSTGEGRLASFTNGSAQITWTRPLSAASTPTTAATIYTQTITLASAWASPTGIYTVVFSDGEARGVQFTNGSVTGFLFQSLTGSPTTSVTIYTPNSPKMLAIVPDIGFSILSYGTVDFDGLYLATGYAPFGDPGNPTGRNGGNASTPSGGNGTDYDILSMMFVKDAKIDFYGPMLHSREHAFWSACCKNIVSNVINIGGVGADGIHLTGPQQGVSINVVSGHCPDNMLAIGTGDYVQFNLSEGDIKGVHIERLYLNGQITTAVNSFGEQQYPIEFEIGDIGGDIQTGRVFLLSTDPNVSQGGLAWARNVKVRTISASTSGATIAAIGPYISDYVEIGSFSLGLANSTGVNLVTPPGSYVKKLKLVAPKSEVDAVGGQNIFYGSNTYSFLDELIIDSSVFKRSTMGGTQGYTVQLAGANCPHIVFNAPTLDGGNGLYQVQPTIETKLDILGIKCPDSIAVGYHLGSARSVAALIGGYIGSQSGSIFNAQGTGTTEMIVTGGGCHIPNTQNLNTSLVQAISRSGSQKITVRNWDIWIDPITLPIDNARGGYFSCNRGGSVGDARYGPAICIGTGGTGSSPSTPGFAAISSAGKLVTSTVPSGSAVTLTSGTPANITSISLPPGDWDVEGTVDYVLAAGTSVTQLQAGVSDTSATLLGQAGNSNVGTDPNAQIAQPAEVPTALPYTMVRPRTRVNVNATTTIYLVTQANFTVSANITAYGTISARLASPNIY